MVFLYFYVFHFIFSNFSTIQCFIFCSASAHFLAMTPSWAQFRDNWFLHPTPIPQPGGAGHLSLSGMGGRHYHSAILNVWSFLTSMKILPASCSSESPAVASTWGVQIVKYPIFFSGMEADRNVKVVGGDVAVL